MVLIASTISIAFSYTVKSKLEEPYQAGIPPFPLSTDDSRSDLHADLHPLQLRHDPSGERTTLGTLPNLTGYQYLILVPEYYSERMVTFAECSSGISSYGPYVVSLMLTEIPRAILQCLLLYGTQTNRLDS